MCEGLKERVAYLADLFAALGGQLRLRLLLCLTRSDVWNGAGSLTLMSQPRDLIPEKKTDKWIETHEAEVLDDCISKCVRSEYSNYLIASSYGVFMVM